MPCWFGAGGAGRCACAALVQGDVKDDVVPLIMKEFGVELKDIFFQEGTGLKVRVGLWAWAWGVAVGVFWNL